MNAESNESSKVGPMYAWENAAGSARRPAETVQAAIVTAPERRDIGAGGGSAAGGPDMVTVVVSLCAVTPQRSLGTLIQSDKGPGSYWGWSLRLGVDE